MAYARNPTWQDGEGLTLINALKLNNLEDNLVTAAQEADDALAAVALRALATTSMTAGTGLTGGGTLAANRTFAVAFGTTSTTACVGNDSRLSDARIPLAHVHSGVDITSGLVPLARLGAGTPGTTTFLRGDANWVAQAQAISIAAGVNLNTLTTPGFYLQATSANATLALNYPETKAGALLVQSFDGAIIVQQYQTFSPDGTVQQYFRSYYNSPATWGPWQTVSKGGHTHASTDITDWSEAVQDSVAGMIVAGTGITKTYDDPTGILTLTASGGGGGSGVMVMDPAVGQYVRGPFPFSTRSGTSSGVPATAKVFIPIAVAYQVGSVVIRVNTAGAAGSTVPVRIYAADGASGRAGTLLRTVSVSTAATGLGIEATFANTAVAPPGVWLDFGTFTDAAVQVQWLRELGPGSNLNTGLGSILNDIGIPENANGSLWQWVPDIAMKRTV